MKYIKFLFPPKIVFVWPENVTQNIDLYQRFLNKIFQYNIDKTWTIDHPNAAVEDIRFIFFYLD